MSVASLIPPPPYRFGKGIHYVVPAGLRTYGPLKNIDIETIDGIIFYVCAKNDIDRCKEKVSKLKLMLIEGAKCNSLEYSGFEAYFKRKLKLDLIPVPLDDVGDPRAVAEAVSDAVLRNIARMVIPIIVLPPHVKSVTTNHYYFTKTMLMSHGIHITQSIRHDTLEDDEKLCASLLPIAMQIFTKVGGIPYAIARPIGGVGYKTLVIGVGLTRVATEERESIEQYMGISTVFASDGTFKLIDVNLVDVDKNKLADALRSSIIKSISRLYQERVLSKDDKVWIIVHYSGKEISRIEEEAIESTCAMLSNMLNLVMEPAIVKIIEDNIYRLFSEPVDMYPVIGTYVELLSGKLYILNTLGYDSISQKRPLRKEMPRSILVSIKKTRREFIRELLFSILALSRVNFSGTQMFYRRPASTSYSRKAARLLSRVLYVSNHLGKGIDVAGIPKDKLWFI